MVSVIIPFYNQHESLNLVLKALSKQNYDEKFEVLVIDDGSIKGPENIINNFEGNRRFKIFLFRNKQNMGRSFTRNNGIVKASGDILIFNDADRIPGYDFISNHVQYLNSNKSTISVGEIKELYFTIDNEEAIWRAIDTKSRLARKAIYYKIVENIFDDQGETDSSIPWIATFSGNMAIRKVDLVEKFDDEFDEWGFEHFELGFRLMKRDVRIKLNRAATNFHIAHSRDYSYYEQKLEKSYKLFMSKHNSKEVTFLFDFITGKISLQDYESKVGGKKEWFKNSNRPLYSKILNY